MSSEIVFSEAQAGSQVSQRDQNQVRWLSTVPFWGVHVAAVVGVIMLGWSWSGLGVAVALYYVRMFGITGGFHRYFAHRTYKTNRVMQFFLALLGGLAVQKGALWWAAHHRNHHKYSDQPEDVHSPVQRGFWWSHVGWILVRKYEPTEWDKIRDFAKYPELRFLNTYNILVAIAFAASLYLIGGAWLLVWGFFVSTTLLWHGTFTINSLSHVFGNRRYETTDDSRNNWFLALITLGEGWHNNHHYYQRAVNNGFYWWEIDITYYILKMMSWVGLVYDLQGVPKHIRDPERAREHLERKRGLAEAKAAREAANTDADQLGALPQPAPVVAAESAA